MSLEGFRQAYVLNAGTATFGEQVTTGISAGTPTPWFAIKPMGGKSAAIGAFFNFVGVATASGPATPVAGSDQLDPFIGGGGQVIVGVAAGGVQRGQTKTRQFAEFVYAVVTNYPFSIAANTTFASAGTSNYSVTLFVPTGGVTAIQFMIPSGVTASWASAVTFAYTSITSYIVSADWSGAVAFNEEKTASLGSGLQTITNYVPQTISPDAVFMQGESSATITQVYIQTVNGFALITSTATAVLQAGAGGIAAVAGTTYTTTAGFVIAGNQQAFQIFQVTFASATTHFIGYVQIAGGADTAPSVSPAPTAGPPAVKQSGTVTAAGQVAYAGAPGGGSGSGGAAGVLARGGSTGAIISRRK
jgi:hypothetical protein